MKSAASYRNANVAPQKTYHVTKQTENIQENIYIFLSFLWTEQHIVQVQADEWDYTPILLPSISRLTCRMLAFVGQMQV